MRKGEGRENTERNGDGRHISCVTSLVDCEGSDDEDWFDDRELKVNRHLTVRSNTDPVQPLLLSSLPARIIGLQLMFFFHRQLIRLLFSELINQSLGFKMYKNYKKRLSQFQ